MRKYEEFKKDIHSVGRVGAEQTQGDFRSIFLFSKYSNRRLSPYSFNETKRAYEFKRIDVKRICLTE